MKKKLNDGIVLLGFGTQLAVTMILGVFLGLWLDNKFETSPLFLIICSVIFFGSSMTFFIKMVNRDKNKHKINNDK